MKLRVIRWRQGVARNRRPVPKPDPVQLRATICGVTWALVRAPAVLTVSMALLWWASIPAFLSFAILAPLTICGVFWGPRDKFFYIVMGASGALWFSGVVVLSLNTSWSGQRSHAVRETPSVVARVDGTDR